MPAGNPLTMSRKELEADNASLRKQFAEAVNRLSRQREEHAEQYEAFQLMAGKNFEELQDAVFALDPDTHVRLYASLESLRRALRIERASH